VQAQPPLDNLLGCAETCKFCFHEKCVKRHAPKHAFRI
jgi:hypothetical protein